MFLGTLIISLSSYFFPSEDKYFFAIVTLYSFLFAFFKYHVIQKNKYLEKEKSLVKEQQKIISIGHISRGLSHQLNNILMEIQLQMSLLDTKLKSCKDDGFDRNLSRLDQSRSSIDKTLTGLNLLIKNFKELNEEDDLIKEHFTINELLSEDSRISYELKSNYTMYASKDKIKTVLNHLYNNAFESHATSISVKIYKKDKSLFFELRNNGEPIESLKKDLLFEGFYTQKNVLNNKGLGLTLSRKFIYEHQGEIWLDSCNPVCFTFKIPFKE